MINILFVDDESNLLDALKRATRPLRNEWCTLFANGGAEALRVLEETPCDVIVTDMRMPGIDGLALLEAVSHRYPGMVRIIFSGQCDTSTIVKAAAISHQYLSKPCDIEILRSTVSRAVGMRKLLSSPALVQLMSAFDRIPVLPSVYSQLTLLLNDDRTSIERIGAVIAQDMGLCAKVLQLANSPIFGLRHPISSPEAAVGVLGFDMLKNLALAMHVFQQYETAIKSFDIESLWQHSFRTSLYAANIARLVAPSDSRLREQAQVAGLLHDIGHLLLACNMPDLFERAIQLASERGIDLFEAERELLGASHAEVGAYVLALWGLPDEITEAILHHHQVRSCESRVAFAVHIADALEYRHGSKDLPGDRHQVDVALLEERGLVDEFKSWEESCCTLHTQAS
ncbi:MAG: HDOD domain-containing protein [Acidobacteriaceae bacterium]|nr:HDOD domain-containing protein [Acidobacteriaceae bacterium]